MSEKTTNGDVQVVSDNGSGKVSFANDVIAVIANLAATEVKGVVGLSAGVISGIAEKLGRKNFTNGVKVEVGDEEVAVDIYLVVDYGAKIHEVSREVQNAVKKAIEDMTGLKVVEVNVFIESISLPKEEKAGGDENEEKKEPRVK